MKPDAKEAIGLHRTGDFYIGLLSDQDCERQMFESAFCDRMRRGTLFESPYKRSPMIPSFIGDVHPASCEFHSQDPSPNMRPFFLD